MNSFTKIFVTLTVPCCLLLLLWNLPVTHSAEFGGKKGLEMVELPEIPRFNENPKKPGYLRPPSLNKSNRTRREVERGLPGFSGLPGIKGERGSPGIVGLPGFPGPKGDKGALGVPGLPGMKGEIGSPGFVGFPGPKGDKGALGVPGLTGMKGEIGSPGFVGLPGFPGIKGDKGAQGVPGLPGMKGERGSPGLVGLPGFSGPKVEAGKACKYGRINVQPELYGMDNKFKFLNREKMDDKPGLEGLEETAGRDGKTEHSELKEIEGTGKNEEPGHPKIKNISETTGINGQKENFRGDGIPGLPGPEGEDGSISNSGNVTSTELLDPEGPPVPEGSIIRVFNPSKESSPCDLDCKENLSLMQEVLKSGQETVQDIACLEARIAVLEDTMRKMLELKERQTPTAEYKSYGDSSLHDSTE